MPPPESKLQLSPNEIRLLKLWIQEGAEYADHWSFVPIRAPTLPNSSNHSSNPIDLFVEEKLRAMQLEPMPPADRSNLIRRLSFDLTGLPPSLDAVDQFTADPSPGAYERLVDRLLDTPAYGERMAVDWLDVARYADTYGYQNDRYRAVWPWRDWVVRAFNQNLRYDQFITWQVAGDLLPNASRDQILATTFNRLHRQTNEGGSVEAEYRPNTWRIESTRLGLHSWD